MTLPALGESVTEGTVTRWLKQVGDEVAVDEPLLEVSTDKVDTEIPSPVAGTLLEIKVSEDETVEVGAELAVDRLRRRRPRRRRSPEEPQAGGEGRGRAGAGARARARAGAGAGARAGRPEPEPKAEEKAPEPKQEEAPAQEAPKHERRRRRPQRLQRRYVTPLVRKLAAQHDVDLSTVTGTGVGGRIRKQDVLDAAAAKKEKAEEPAAAPAAAGRSSSRGEPRSGRSRRRRCAARPSRSRGCAR